MTLFPTECCVSWIPLLHLFQNKHYIYLVWLMIGIMALVVIIKLPQIKFHFLPYHDENNSQDFVLVTLPSSFSSAAGAYCLDGSPPGYYYRFNPKKYVNSWIIYLPGGAWCTTKYECALRSQTHLGSSHLAPSSVNHTGFLSNNCDLNPEFCSWNVIILLYCDGGSFLGNVSGILQHGTRSLYLRGALVFDTVLEYLLATTHLAMAERIVLAGSSAGGIGALIHADRLHTILPKSVTTVQVLVDAAMFADVLSVSGQNITANTFQSVYNIHYLKSSLSPQKCIQKQTPGHEWRCLLPEVYHYYVSTPTFFINSVYDTWQRHHFLDIPCYATVCPNAHTDTINQLRDAIQQLAKKINQQSKKNSVFLTLCPLHTIMIKSSFFGLNNPTLQRSVFSWLQNDTAPTNLDTTLSIKAALELCDIA